MVINDGEMEVNDCNVTSGSDFVITEVQTDLSPATVSIPMNRTSKSHRILLYLYGVFQLKQALSYVKEHLKPSPVFPDDYEFTIQTTENVDDLVKVRYQSRHIDSEIYHTYVEYSSSTLPPITGWYCSCIVGERTIGRCRHVAATLWHLCLDQAVTHQTKRTYNNFFDFVEDTTQFSDYENTSDEDDDKTLYELV
ncbi:unnamed protein product [Didymodactylos carnosus]|uniref:SWIM-type domain-containing protein n=1 Tax=Didymodactylos carnosus TaxID=1234261 RepID=A0A815QBB6_9BILA|nr:unnamed protein product [Didymodactylos carnosus]CAF1461048.1 unnamed protein product [Didymodactylos carnosus]CAF3674593.1 unnamed protein product [Didymodactylos carnosus]CAF4331363.1 unnamed protein product [Didymodactylos carnosus]